MSQSSSALAVRRMPHSCTQLSEQDYETIYAAVMETERGRRFVAELVRRNRIADTTLVLAAVEKLAASVQTGLAKATAKDGTLKHSEPAVIRATMPAPGTWRNAYITQMQSSQPAGAAPDRGAVATTQTASNFGKLATHEANATQDRFLFNGHNQCGNPLLASKVPQVETPAASGPFSAPAMGTVDNPAPTIPAPTKPEIDEYELMTAKQKLALLNGI